MYDLLSAISSLHIFLFLLGTVQAEERAPNILWIVAEDMSPDFACYGQEAIETPNVDALAKTGMQFDQVFSTGPACSPSRTALATGVFQTTLGAYHMRYPSNLKPELAEGVQTLPQLIRDRGYFTGNVKGMAGFGTGKDDWQFRVNADQGWDTNSWDKLKQRQPFFAQVQFRESHRSFSGSLSKQEKKLIAIPPYYPDHSVTRDDWAGYLASVKKFDAGVGRVLAQLEEDELADNTIVFLFSDHGRPMTRGKNWLYDSGIQIPLIVYIPPATKLPEKYKAGSRSSQLLSAIDIVAETVAMAGGEIPAWMQGRTFLQEDSIARKQVFGALDRIGNIEVQSRAVRTDRYKYIRNYKTPASINECSTPYRRSTHPIFHLLNVLREQGELTDAQQRLVAPMESQELYDLKSDPHELNNLAERDKVSAVKDDLKKKLDDWIEESRDRGFDADSSALQEYFKQYGVNTLKQRAKNIERLNKTVRQKVKNAPARSSSKVEESFKP